MERSLQFLDTLGSHGRTRLSIKLFSVKTPVLPSIVGALAAAVWRAPAQACTEDCYSTTATLPHQSHLVAPSVLGTALTLT